MDPLNNFTTYPRINSSNNSTAYLRRQIISFSKRLASLKSTKEVLEVEHNSSRVILGVVYDEDEGSTFYVEHSGNRIPICGVSSITDEYVFNVSAFYSLSSFFKEIEDKFSIFSKKPCS